MERYDIHYATLLRLAEAEEPAAGAAMALGFFDGVHLGHAEVIRAAVEAARAKGLKPAILTFEPHPRAVLGQEQYRTVLTPLEDKLALFAGLGIEAAYVISFDRDFAQVTAERFVRELLLPLGVRTAVVGFDFAFGHKGAGTADTLRRDAAGLIDVTVVEPVFREGVKVSSTRIRDLLVAGDCAAASEALGRPYALRGTVVHGDARGRLLGFPTANLSLTDPYVLPANGVYAVTATRRSDPSATYRGVMNVGVRPTFDAPGGAPRLEAHLFDFAGDLYGDELTVRFHAMLRPERKFASVDELKEQIRRDAGQAREALAGMAETAERLP